MTQLEPSGNPVPVGLAVIYTPGLAGTAQSLDPGSDDLRAAEVSTAELETALANQDVVPQQTIEITGAYEVPDGGGQTRSTATGEPAIVLEVPGPGTGLGQVVLAQDESGVVTWNLPHDAQGEGAASRGADTLTYVIRRYVPAQADGDTETRGLLGAVGKKLLKVLVFPLVDPLIEKGAKSLAAAWETSKRPYRCRSFEPGDYRDAAGTPIAGDRWGELAGDRALLLLHGTFSRAHSGFGGMPPELVKALHDHYGGRVLAFDHFTLAHDPLRNATELAKLVPDGTRLDVDIVCHSRGGLLARTLAERPPGELREKLAVNRVVFVATPNAGTVLADGKRMGALVDRYTTLLNLFPDNGVTETLEAIITVVKQLAVGALAGLDGLASMRPGGDFLSALNEGGQADGTYFALASNYEPQGGLRAFAKDGVMDFVFAKAHNDLVVPTDGVSAANGSGRFPITQLEAFAEADGIHHSGYFANPRAGERILGWLSA